MQILLTHAYWITKIAWFQGDSGGPILERILTYDSEGHVVKSQYQVVGIVSAGIGMTPKYMFVCSFLTYTFC